MSNPEYRQSCELLRRAITQEVISVTLPAVAKWRGWGDDMLAKCIQNVSRKWKSLSSPSPWLGQQSSWQLPQTRRYQQSRFPSENPVTHASSTLDWMVELARWPVPIGSVGVVKSFEQFVGEEQSVYTTSNNWGNPYPLTMNIRWFFRLSPIDSLSEPWIDVTGGGAVPQYLPGLPYNDLPFTDDLWFPAGSCSSANIHLPVPGGYSLRIVAIVTAPDFDIRIAAKICGSVQSETNKDAQFVLRTSW